jgi:hypothetical protein
MKGKTPIWLAALSSCGLAVAPGCSGGEDLSDARDAGGVIPPDAGAAVPDAPRGFPVLDAGHDAARNGDEFMPGDHIGPDAASLDAATDAAPSDAALADAGGCKPKLAMPLSGAFLQLTNSYGAAFWKTAIDRMRDAGMSTAIIQTVAYANSNGTANSVNAAVIKAVLDEAAAVGIDVYIGLRLEVGNGSPSAAADAATVNGWIADAESSADSIATAYGMHPAFAGWYLPMEGWTPARAGELGFLPSYYAAASSYCKTKKDLPVAISPFISSGALAAGNAPALTTSAYSAILAASSIDVVMLQDGTGALPIAPAAVGSSVPPFMAAMKAACAAHHVELWANAEAFEHDFATPTTFDRMKMQLAAASPSAARAVTFEFSSYWDGAGPGGAAAASLFDGYMQARQGCAP